MTNFSPKETHENMHGLHLLEASETHFHATFTYILYSFKDVISSSVRYGMAASHIPAQQFKPGSESGVETGSGSAWQYCTRHCRSS